VRQDVGGNRRRGTNGLGNDGRLARAGTGERDGAPALGNADGRAARRESVARRLDAAMPA